MKHLDAFTYVPDLIGVPDPQILAADLFSEGHFSCAHAEYNGWQVTEHPETRAAVDGILNRLWDVHFAKGA